MMNIEEMFNGAQMQLRERTLEPRVRLLTDITRPDPALVPNYQGSRLSLKTGAIGRLDYRVRGPNGEQDGSCKASFHKDAAYAAHIYTEVNSDGVYLAVGEFETLPPMRRVILDLQRAEIPITDSEAALLRTAYLIDPCYDDICRQAGEEGEVYAYHMRNEEPFYFRLAEKAIGRVLQFEMDGTLVPYLETVDPSMSTSGDV